MEHVLKILETDRKKVERAGSSSQTPLKVDSILSWKHRCTARTVQSEGLPKHCIM